MATSNPSVLLARRMGLPYRTASAVAFCCSHCRRDRGGRQGQILGVAFDQGSGSWWWAPAVKHRMHFFDDSDTTPGMLTIREEALRRLIHLDGEHLVVNMNCRVPRHPARPRATSWIRAQASAALDGGFHLVHVAAP